MCGTPQCGRSCHCYRIGPRCYCGNNEHVGGRRTGTERQPHIDEDTLELYAFDRAKDEPEFERIEERLFVCTICQDRLAAEDAFTSALRLALKRVGWTHVHLTEDSEVKTCAYQTRSGKYIGRVIGAGVDCGTWRESVAEAPEHRSGSATIHPSELAESLR
jgi:hypothetical protein